LFGDAQLLVRKCMPFGSVPSRRGRGFGLGFACGALDH
jgi:hypothetical protein